MDRRIDTKEKLEEEAWLVNQQISLTHKHMSNSECYEKLKKLHKKNPDLFMNPEDWKRLKLKEIKGERLET